MADSIRETIILALITRLETITVANGYETGIGAKVFRGINTALEKTSLPGVILNEGTETVDPTITMLHDHYILPIDLALRTTYADGEDWYALCNKMLADIIKALGVDETFGGKVMRVEPGMSSKTGSVEGEHLTAGVDMTFTLQYRTLHLNPYA